MSQHKYDSPSIFAAITVYKYRYSRHKQHSIWIDLVYFGAIVLPAHRDVHRHTLATCTFLSCVRTFSSYFIENKWRLPESAIFFSVLSLHFYFICCIIFFFVVCSFIRCFSDIFFFFSIYLSVVRSLCRYYFRAIFAPINRDIDTWRVCVYVYAAVWTSSSTAYFMASQTNKVKENVREIRWNAMISLSANNIENVRVRACTLFTHNMQPRHKYTHTAKGERR